MKDKKKKLLLDETEVKFILEKNRDYIGHKFIFGFDSIIAGMGYVVTIFLSDFKDYNWLKYPLSVIGIVYLIWGMYNICRYYKNKHFNKDTLYKQLEDINYMENSEHSIILIKDDFNQNPNKFLVYQDPRWDCRLFVNFHTCGNNEAENIDNIKQHVEQELKTKSDNCAFLFDKLHSKFSVSAKREKYYHHKFYRLSIEANSDIQKQSFTIDGKTYYWMSIAEMENDKNIMRKNSDIISFVKESNV